MSIKDKTILKNIINKYSKTIIKNIIKLYILNKNNLLLNTKEEIIENMIIDLLKLNPKDLENLINIIFIKYDINEDKDLKGFKLIEEKYLNNNIIINFSLTKNFYY